MHTCDGPAEVLLSALPPLSSSHASSSVRFASAQWLHTGALLHPVVPHFSSAQTTRRSGQRQSSEPLYRPFMETATLERNLLAAWHPLHLCRWDAPWSGL